MVYAVLLIALLAGYAAFLQIRLRKIQKNLKELIVENDRQTTQDNAKQDGNIYFKTDLDFNITYVNDSTCKALGFGEEELIGKKILGTLMEDNEANKEKLSENLRQIINNQATINTESVLSRKNGEKILMRCRKRPILNEILKCEGISYLCRDISETSVLQQKLKDYASRDILAADILNEDAFLKRFEHDFDLNKRYNNDFSLIVIELKDIYEFASRGIDFDTGDKLLKAAADLCTRELGGGQNIGRFDKTKLGIILNKTPREEAAQDAVKLQKMIIADIRKLNIDAYNAEMFVISYTERKNFNDTADNMLGRVRRHIAAALKNREYGIKSSDRK